MWWTEDGDRILTDAEWEVFNTGLDLLRDFIEGDISVGKDDGDHSGYRAFDELTSEQKLGILADVAEALRYTSVPSPALTAANEAAVAAVFDTFKMMLMTEIEFNQSNTGERRTVLRQLLLEAVGNTEDFEDPLPSADDVDTKEWDFLLEVIEGRVFWDNDFTMSDAFLDLPSEEARVQLELCGIDPDYYMSIPPEPDESGLNEVRKRLAQVQGS
jgi:hypothetical protein